MKLLNKLSGQGFEVKLFVVSVSMGDDWKIIVEVGSQRRKGAP